jgi:integrase
MGCRPAYRARVAFPALCDERREFPSLDHEAVGRLIAATPDRYRVLVAVSVLTGLRQGESLGLRWQDVDVREGVIRVRRQLDRGRARRAEDAGGEARRADPGVARADVRGAPPRLAALGRDGLRVLLDGRDAARPAER